MPLRKQLGHERHRGVPGLWDLDLKLTLPGLQMPGPEPVPQPIVLQTALLLRATHVASATEPAIELLLDRPLDDQPCTQAGELTKHLLRVIDHALPKQPVDLSLYLRRRRYGASHGVGLLLRLAGLEGTYAVSPTAPAQLFTAVPRRSLPMVASPYSPPARRTTPAA
jgi:hypothetical protein